MVLTLRCHFHLAQRLIRLNPPSAQLHSFKPWLNISTINLSYHFISIESTTFSQREACLPSSFITCQRILSRINSLLVLNYILDLLTYLSAILSILAPPHPSTLTVPLSPSPYCPLTSCFWNPAPPSNRTISHSGNPQQTSQIYPRPRKVV